MQEKAQLREQMTTVREGLGREERTRIDAAIADQVRTLPAYETATHVFTYLSFGSEIDTRAIIRDAWDAGKLVAVPRCVPGTRNMNWHAIEGFEALVPGSFGIDEPADDPDTLVDPARADGSRAIALVPALSIDRRGFRLGYGGGYYDRFLPGFPGTSVGLCRDAQLSAEPLPAAENDVPVQIVVTESSVARPV